MNRYTLFALVMIFVVLILIMFDDGEDSTTITGYADDIHQSENGFTFTINDADGNKVKAFSRIEMDDSLHSFKGSYSQDGGMFFVNGFD